MTTAQQNENEPERRIRISIPNIRADAVRWYLPIFNLLTVYLTVTNTLFAAARDSATSWQAIQYIATGELLKAGGVALIVSPTIAEGIRMVLVGINHAEVGVADSLYVYCVIHRNRARGK